MDGVLIFSTIDLPGVLNALPAEPTAYWLDPTLPAFEFLTIHHQEDSFDQWKALLIQLSALEALPHNASYLMLLCAGTLKLIGRITAPFLVWSWQNSYNHHRPTEFLFWQNTAAFL